MEPFFDLVLLPQVDSSARENINSPRYFKFFFRKLQQQVVIVHGSNNVILQKYEVHCFIEQIHVIMQTIFNAPVPAHGSGKGIDIC